MEFLDAFAHSGYPVERCRLFFNDLEFNVYIWSDWMEGVQPKIAHEAFDYFNAVASEESNMLCRGVWVKKVDGGYIVR